MNRRWIAWAGVLLLAVALPVLGVAQRGMPRREDAARLRQKVDQIQRHAESNSTRPLLTPVTESEVNAYLAFDAGEQIPVGLTDPYISIVGDGRLAGTAVVDLDVVREQRKSRGWLDPLAYLSGRVPVAVTGTLAVRDGLARFDLESAKLAGVAIPKVIVQELLTFYSRTESNPRGLNLDDPYPLPARIRQIDVGRGEALVKQ